MGCRIPNPWTYVDMASRLETLEADRNRLREELARLRAGQDPPVHLEILFETATGLVDAEAIGPFVQDIFERLTARFPLAGCLFYRPVEEREDELELAACTGVEDGTREAIRRLTLDELRCGTGGSDSNPVVANLEDAHSSEAGPLGGLGLTAYACFPLVSPSGSHGTFSFFRREGPGFSPRDIRLLRFISDLVALAWDRKRAERRLIESESRYRDLADHSPDATLVTVDERVVYANRAAARLLGADGPADVIERSIFDLIDPEFHDLVRRRIWRPLKEPSGTPRVECRWSRTDGTPVDVEVLAGRVEWQGQPAIQSVVRDITERKRIERERGELLERIDEERRRFDAILGATEDFVYLFDLTGRVLYANPALLGVWGMDARSVVGRSLDELGYPTDVVESQKAHIARIASEKKGFRGEVALEELGDGVRHFEYTLVPVLGDDGAPEAVAGIAREITEYKHFEGEIEAARRSAEATSQAKSEFLAMMSHELRTPLSGAFGFVRLLEAGILGPVNEEQKEALRRLGSGLAHLTGIIEEILTFSRAEAGREVVRWTRADVADLARDLVLHTEAQARAHGLSLRFEAEGDARVDTDPGKIRQILINLVDNAIKYTESGEVVVEVDGSSADQVQIHVRDTGPGIPEEDQEKIFEPFTQGGRFLTRDTRGTGLGLAICRRLARLVGGELGLRSTPGEGSAFTVRLPRNRAGGESGGADRPSTP